MSDQGIKSKPNYPGIRPDTTATRHVLVGEGTGANALARLLGEFATTPSVDAGAVSVLYTPGRGPDHSERLVDLVSSSFRVCGDTEELLSALRTSLAQAGMGTRMYIAGSESFIWPAVAEARAMGLAEAAMWMERSGRPARPVCCIHCKTVTHGVAITIYQCPGCGLHLFVRDHFSRRLGVYQGVCVDAEAPGELPEVEELDS